MTKFPDAYKKHIFDHSEDIIEVARVIIAKHPDLTLPEACRIVMAAHTDTTLSALYNSVSFEAHQSVRKIK